MMILHVFIHNEYGVKVADILLPYRMIRLTIKSQE